MRKWISLLLALALLLPLLPTGAGAAETDELRQAITEQYDAYAASIAQPNADEEAVRQLLNHSIDHPGQELAMDERDPFTASLFQSNMFRECFIKASCAAYDLIYQNQLDRVLLGGTHLTWYDFALRYGVRHYEYTDDVPVSDGETYIASVIPYQECSQPANEHDEAMTLVMGGGSYWIRYNVIFRNMEKIVCRVDIMVNDSFNFDGSYNGKGFDGYDVSTAMLITMAGKLFLNEYSWSTSVSLELTMPNLCTHESADYCWKFDVLDPVSYGGGDTTENPLALIQEYRPDGTKFGPYYKTAEPAYLRHNLPWTLEFRTKGNASLMLSPTVSYRDNVPYLMKGGTCMFGGYPIATKVYDEESQKEVTKYSRYFYGVNFADFGYKSSEWHIYRLENRIAEDGRNAVYLWVDGTELGPMINHYAFDAEPLESQGDWFSGVDFEISYIGTNNVKLYPPLEIDYIQIWENGEGNDPYSYFKTTAAAPTCTESGKIVHTCSLCGASYSEATGEAALGHTLETIPGTAATCEGEGLTEGTRCTTCGEIVTAQETIPALGHSPVVDAAVAAACTAEGMTEGSHCSACGTVLTAQEVIPATGHSWNDGELTSRPTVNTSGTFVYTCTACGEAKTEEVPYEPHVSRLAGEHRYETAFLTADQMKVNLGIEKFDAVVVASGTNFADALSGSYLAAVKNAPILLACDVDWVNDLVKDYIRQNLNEGGTVYILGGEGAIPASFEEGLDGFTISRLAGENRFLTNLLVLQEAGVSDQPILICSGLGFADSLSASATKLPILLVYGDELTAEQTDFVGSLDKNKLYVIGGEGAVSAEMQNALSYHGATLRIGGKTRFETSTLIAETFFEKPESAVLAYAWDFPDGLCGGPLAATMNAPLILTMEKYEAQAASYIQSNAITNATILGGEKLIPESSVNLIFN